MKAKEITASQFWKEISIDTKPIPYTHAWEKPDEYPIDLMRLKPYLSTPRDPSSDLVREMAIGRGFFYRRKEIESLSRAVLTFASIVVCDERLLLPGKSRYANCVICYATDDRHRLNIDWLSRMNEYLNRLLLDGHSKQEKKLAKLLGDFTAYFSMRLPDEISGEAEAWLATIRFEDQSELPHSCVPMQKILPFLLVDYGKIKPFRKHCLVPRHFYEISTGIRLEPDDL